jgi:hypothetical protein
MLWFLEEAMQTHEMELTVTTRQAQTVAQWLDELADESARSQSGDGGVALALAAAKLRKLGDVPMRSHVAPIAWIRCRAVPNGPGSARYHYDFFPGREPPENDQVSWAPLYSWPLQDDPPVVMAREHHLHHHFHIPEGHELVCTGERIFVAPIGGAT